MEPKRYYRAAKGEVPKGDYHVPLGKAAVIQEGEDITVISYGAMTHTARSAARKIHEKDQISVEIIDLRTLVPYDLETVLESVEKTGRAIIIHEAPKTGGFGAEMAAEISEKALLSLHAPVFRVTGFDTPFPYTLEMEYLPNEHRIRKAIQDSINF